MRSEFLKDSRQFSDKAGVRRLGAQKRITESEPKICNRAFLLQVCAKA
jgi:hypothetical protein